MVYCRHVLNIVEIYRAMICVETLLVNERMNAKSHREKVEFKNGSIRAGVPWHDEISSV